MGPESMTSQVIAPMLAKLVADIPPGLFYEPKWDGFRAIVERDGSDVELHSRNGKPMARYFPDLVAALLEQLPERCTVDGEIVVIAPSGRLDFFALQQRIHPAASRIGRLAGETPASFVAFDLLDELERPFRERRAALEAMRWEPPLYLTPVTRDERVARDWFDRFEGAGLDGVIAKDGELPYRPGQRVMFKVKHQRTADCVIAGYRLHKSEPEAIGSLMLGLYGDDGLWPIGASASFRLAFRRELLTMLSPLRTGADAHPWGKWLQEQPSRWNPARDQPFVPLDPVRVIEVRYDHMDGRFLRHPATFLRWRDDRDAASCTFEQLIEAEAVDVRAALRAAP
jgi:ATP-dependent DNA ligase